jgi:hypothetical protein
MQETTVPEGRAVKNESNDATERPALHLSSGDMDADEVLDFFRRLVGREPTAEEIAELNADFND